MPSDEIEREEISDVEWEYDDFLKRGKTNIEKIIEPLSSAERSKAKMCLSLNVDDDGSDLDAVEENIIETLNGYDFVHSVSTEYEDFHQGAGQQIFYIKFC